MTTIVQFPQLEAPPVTPLRGTLFDAARVVDGLPVGHLADGMDDLYESWACINGYNVVTGPCPQRPTKTFENVPWASSFYLTTYLGVTCKGPGFSYEEAPAKLRTLYESMESRMVARQLFDEVGQGTDITPGGMPIDAVAAVGYLEGWAAEFYAGTPTIHMGRNAIANLCQQLDTSGSTFRTCAGSKVAADGNERRMLVTGEVTIARGELILVPAINTSTNDMSFLAERSYLVSHDCLDAYITTTLQDSGIQ